MNTDEQKRLALQKMKRVATAMLVFATLLFVLASTQSGFWWGLLKAVAEASMVGAIADWFAVTALFRHPLGIPIPHTAIIPQNKNQIGNSLGNFVQKYFLNPELVREKIAGMNIAHKVGAWMVEPKNVDLLMDRLVAYVPQILHKLNDETIQAFLHKNISQELRKVQFSPILGKGLAHLITTKQFEPLLETLLKSVAEWIERNEENIANFIEQHKPWYVPKFMYEGKLFDELPKNLKEIFHDPNHPRREDVMKVLNSFASNLQHDERWIQNGNDIRDKVLDNDTLRSYISELWLKTKQRIGDDLKAEDSKIGEMLQNGTYRLGNALLKDQDTQKALNHNIEELTTNLVAERGQEFAKFIAETIEKWDSQTMVERIELSVGRDLQFIRINGTLVGGLVGGLLYLISITLK